MANGTFPTLSLNRGEDFRQVLSYAIVLIAPCLIFGNGLIVVTMIKFRWLRSHTNYFLLSLSAVGLLDGVLIIPIEVLHPLHVVLPSGLCHFAAYATFVKSVLTASHLLTINIDRLFSIQYPLKHKTLMTNKIAFVVIVCVWVLSIGTTIVFTILLCDSSILICRMFPKSGAAAVWLTVLLFWLPFVLIGITYVSIYIVVRRHLDFLRQNGDQLATVRSRAFLKVIAGTVGVLFFGYSPLGICLDVVYFVGTKDTDIIIFYVLPAAELFTHVALSLNPLVYGLASPKFKKAISELFHCCPCVNSKVATTNVTAARTGNGTRGDTCRPQTLTTHDA